MVAWIRAGSALAARFEGFLGSGWVRPSTESEEWHMLYRFADDASLATWEASPQREWWLGAAQGLVGSPASSAGPASRAGSTRPRRTTSRTCARPPRAAAVEAGDA